MPLDTVSPPSEPARKGARRFLGFFLDAWQQMLRRRGVSTLHYLTKPEAPTFAFSVAAHAILSFFPFMVLMMWLIRHVFHSHNMEDVLVLLPPHHLPAAHAFLIPHPYPPV